MDTSPSNADSPSTPASTAPALPTASTPSTPPPAEPGAHYHGLGGEEGVRRLVDRFYDLMDSAPEAVHVRALHAASLKRSREKLFMYLSGWTGGPPLYEAQYGHPRLRARHLPFTIGARERDEWLWCMEKALDEQEVDPPLREFLRQRIRQLADHMRNQPE